MKNAIILYPRKNKFHKHAKNHGLTLSVIRIIPIILDDRKNLVLRIRFYRVHINPAHHSKPPVEKSQHTIRFIRLARLKTYLIDYHHTGSRIANRINRTAFYFLQNSIML